MSAWSALAIVLMVGTMTYVMRAGVILALAGRAVPVPVERALRNVGPAVLAALAINLAAGGEGGPSLELARGGRTRRGRWRRMVAPQPDLDADRRHVHAVGADGADLSPRTARLTRGRGRVGRVASTHDRACIDVGRVAGFGVGVPPRQGRDPGQRGRQDQRRRAAVHRRRRLRAHRDATARERTARRTRRDLPRRARSGQDPHHPVAHRAARRVDADRRRQRDQRRSVPSRVAARPRPDRRHGRRHADRLGAPRHPLRREAGHARHVDRRPDRRGRSDQGGRGSIPVRRAHAALRTRAAHQPRHLRHQRAPRSRRTHPGRHAQRARRTRRPDPRLQDPPAARRHAGRLGQPRGLHQSRSHHHAAQGSLRIADPHALSRSTPRSSTRSCSRRPASCRSARPSA